MNDSTDVAEWIVEQCDASPPQDVPEHEKMFSDLDDGRLSDALFKLWRKGIMHAEWDEDAAETGWRLTAFGVELVERGLLRPYIMALEEDIQIDAGPDLLAGETA